MSRVNNSSHPGATLRCVRRPGAGPTCTWSARADTFSPAVDSGPASAGQRVEVAGLDATCARLDLAQHPVDRGVERCRHATARAPADDLARHGIDLDRAAELEVPPGDRLDASEVAADGRQRLLQRVAPAGAAAGDEGRRNEAEEIVEPHALRGGDVDSFGHDLREQPRV